MDYMQQITSITIIAAALASKLSVSELQLLLSILTQLANTLGTILICKSNNAIASNGMSNESIIVNNNTNTL